MILQMAFALALMAPARPNLVIMMTDDQRADALSCAGNRILKTPNLDRIAREGVRFRNAFVVNALCAPSRATLLTGLYSHSHGVIDNNNRPIRRDSPFLPDLLRQAGYDVAFCGKSHVQGALRDRQWDYYFGYRGQGVYMNPMIAEGAQSQDQRHSGYMDDIVTDKAVAWMRRSRSKPFCLFLFFKAPHRSWERAPRHAELYKNDTIPLPSTYQDDVFGYPGKPRAFAQADNKVGTFADIPSLDKMVKDYYATLVAVDENVGKVLGALDEMGATKNTAVLFTSDNGFFHGEWRMMDKRLMHEPSIRVPMLVRYPAVVRKRTLCDRMALNLDIAPTVLQLAGAPVPKAMQGRSLVPLLKRPKAEFREDWLYEYFEYPGPHSVRKNRGVRTERYKLIHYYEAPEEWELYDLENDPGELENLYGLPGTEALYNRLKERIAALRRETGETMGEQH